MQELKDLVDRKVLKLFVGPREHSVYFELDNGKILCADTEADCCSETWFADIVGVQSLIGGEVRSVENLEVPDGDDSRTRQEYDRFYGFKITTVYGHCDFIYRNSSNGYYSGWLSNARFVEATPPGARQVTDDFQA